MAEAPVSACINVCVMHPREAVCIGCFRTMDEIVGWSALDDSACCSVMQGLPARKACIIERRRQSRSRRD